MEEFEEAVCVSFHVIYLRAGDGQRARTAAGTG
jgi:hypothetical protein